MSKSDYLEAQLLDHVLRNVIYTSPSAVYVALFTVAQTEGGAGTEVTGGSYARQQVVFDGVIGGAVLNQSDVIFPQATADWGTIVSFGIYDDPSAGNLLYYGSVSPNRAVLTGDQFAFYQGQLKVAED